MKKFWIILMLFALLFAAASCAVENPVRELCEVSFAHEKKNAKTTIGSSVNGSSLTDEDLQQKYTYWYLKAKANHDASYGDTGNNYVAIGSTKRSYFTQGNWDFSLICLAENYGESFKEEDLKSDYATQKKDYLKSNNLDDIFINLNTSSLTFTVNRVNPSVTNSTLSLDYVYEIKNGQDSNDLYFSLEFYSLSSGALVYSTTPSKDATSPWTETTETAKKKLNGTLDADQIFSSGLYTFVIKVCDDNLETPVFTDLTAFEIRESCLTEIYGTCDHITVSYKSALSIEFTNNIKINTNCIALSLNNYVQERTFHSTPSLNIGNGRTVPYFECHIIKNVADEQTISIPMTMQIPEELGEDYSVFAHLETKESGSTATLLPLAFDTEERTCTVSISPDMTPNSIRTYELYLSVLGNNGMCGELAVGFVVDVDISDNTSGDNGIFAVSAAGELFVVPGRELDLRGSITLPTTVDGKTYSAIQKNAFRNCTAMVSIHIPECVKSIGDEAFLGLCGLITVEFESSDINLGTAVFNRCNGLENVIFLKDEGSNRTWGQNVFNDNHSLINFKIPHSISTLNTWTFTSCMSLTSLEIPTTLLKFEAKAIGRNLKLKTLTVEKGHPKFFDEGNCVLEYNGNTRADGEKTTTLVLGCAGSVIPHSVSIIKSWALGYATGYVLYYDGTVSEWNNITKQSSWNGNTKGNKVICLRETSTKNYVTF